MAPFDYYSAARQIAEYEKRRPKKYRNSGWRYYDSFYRGARYGRPLPETGNMYYTTQAWRVLQKCWKGYKIAKGQDDVGKMKYYAEGIRKAQKELGLKIECFPQLALYATDVPLEQGSDSESAEDDYSYESEAQRRWREKMEYYYH
jgi:hypothetical protein